MCGIVGIAGFTPANQLIYNALMALQHRGQDAAGIITIDDARNRFCLRKANGLVKDVFNAQFMSMLQGSMGIGHVRYPTSGGYSASEAQPFYVNSPFGIALAHNGNLTNTRELRQQMLSAQRRINTLSDSEILLNILANELDRFPDYSLQPDHIFTAITALHQQIRGAYACVAMIIGHGMVAFRDPNGIRPLVMGKRTLKDGRSEYMFASESVALNTLGFVLVRDIAPGEAVYINQEGELFTRECAVDPQCKPCLFEYVYFARSGSLINKISVYHARVRMGQKLGEKIALEWKDLPIDAVIPIPETSCDIALEVARILNKPYRQGIVRNRYVDRTFIMSSQRTRRKSVRRKLNANHAEFHDKNVLLVDDSIVRGTTAEQAVKIARSAGAKQVYFASAAPAVRFPNVYGIDIPSTDALIAHGGGIDGIKQKIGADALIFQNLADLITAVREDNADIMQFECSIFDGIYVTNDIDSPYFEYVKTQGSTS